MSITTSPAPLWNRRGLVIPRQAEGDGSHVVGDPCIVWDSQEDAWRMFLFFDPPGHASSLGRRGKDGNIEWSEPSPLRFTNLDESGLRTHKPFIVMESGAPENPLSNHAAKVQGRYWMLTVSFDPSNGKKFVQRASASTLGGEWTLEEGALLNIGGPGAFDERHVDAVTGYWFPERECFLYFYMGYPKAPQPYPTSPFGSAIGAAAQYLGKPAQKLGPILTPSNIEGHWASGWMGGLQLVRGTKHRWVGLLNASPTPPDHSGELTSEEPAPSLGGLAWTDADFPTSGWVLASNPIEQIDEVPFSAVKDGEGTNLWRHHLLVDDDQAIIYYNSGFYGSEQLYSKQGDVATISAFDESTDVRTSGKDL